MIIFDNYHEWEKPELVFIYDFYMTVPAGSISVVLVPDSKPLSS